MTGKIVTDKEGSKRPKTDRKERLAEQLRANLQRRKAQARSRREADSRPDGISAARKGAGEAE